MKPGPGVPHSHPGHCFKWSGFLLCDPFQNHKMTVASSSLPWSSSKPVPLSSINDCFIPRGLFLDSEYGSHSHVCQTIQHHTPNAKTHQSAHSFIIHLVVCLTTGPKPLTKPALHIVRSRASSFKWGYPLLSLRSSNSFLRLLPCLPVTSIPPCIFPLITRCRRQFLRKMWPIQFAFRLRISCRIFLCSMTLSSTSSFLTWSFPLIFSILLQHHISKLSSCFWSTGHSTVR